MNGLLKKADYHALDPLLDPPKTRNQEERRNASGHAVAGTALGALAGNALGHLNNPDKTWKGDSLNLARITGRTAGGSIAGTLAGNALGNRSIYKKRQQRGEPLNTPEEDEAKNEVVSLDESPIKGQFTQ